MRDGAHGLPWGRAPGRVGVRMPTHFEITTRRTVRHREAGGSRPVPSPHSAPADAIASPSLDTRLAAVLDPAVGLADLAVAFDGVRDDRHPTAALIRATVAARLHVAWLAADGDVVTACRVARAAAHRVPLPIPVAVLARAARWSPLVRATIGRALRANPDPIAAMLGTRWCRAVGGVPEEEPP